MKDKRDLQIIIKDWLLFTVIFSLINLVFLKHDGIKYNLLHALFWSIVYLIILIIKHYRSK